MGEVAQVRLSEWQVHEQERMKRVGIKVGAAMMSLGFIMGYTAGYVVWRML
jgi:hypothetical protein